MNKPEVRCPSCGANPAKAPSRGGVKSKIQSLLPKEEVDTDLPVGETDDDHDTPTVGGDLDSETEIPEVSEEP